jgi:ABC-type multidrug transport system fused ATPase/permease subunit
MGVTVGATYVGEDVAWAVTNDLRDRLAEHCLRLDMRFHSEHRPGELIERIDGDVTQIAGLFSRLVIELLGNFLLLLGTLVALVIEERPWWLSFGPWQASAWAWSSWRPGGPCRAARSPSAISRSLRFCCRVSAC